MCGECETFCIKKTIIVLLYKKGGWIDLKNYRKIPLLSGLFRVFSEIITKCLTKELYF